MECKTGLKWIKHKRRHLPSLFIINFETRLHRQINDKIKTYNKTLFPGCLCGVLIISIQLATVKSFMPEVLII